MAQANFSYGLEGDSPANSLRMGLVVSIFAERPHLLAQLKEDCQAAGLTIGSCGKIAALLEADALPLGDLVLVDCPEADVAGLAALARLDMRAAHSGAQLVVSTSVASLDDVFACLDQSNPQILVDPGRSERVVALGQALANLPRLRLRELAEDDRLMLLRLTEQVGGIARRLERMKAELADRGGTISGDESMFRVESPPSGYRGDNDDNGGQQRASRPSLPDPRLVRRIIRQRHLRGKFFDSSLFADPAWDILLDLTAARAEHVRVSVTSLCIASGVPPTTALRWIGQMVDAGLLERVEDEEDRRRAYIALSDKTAEAIARYFAEIGDQAKWSS